MKTESGYDETCTETGKHTPFTPTDNRGPEGETKLEGSGLPIYRELSNVVRGRLALS